jgi:DNA polymerase-3 subunit delta'
MIYHHHNAYKRLSGFLRKGKIPHALLFTGIEGVGKRTTAMTFAMGCNCGGSSVVSGELSVVSGNPQPTTHPHPCGSCRSCKKILSGNHPDVSLIEPSGPYIRIAQIRELCHTLGMKPYEAKTRVVVIANAQTMNPEAANALLKVLEEPPERTVLILTAIQTSDLLPTILSRCQHVRFDPIPKEDIESLLIKEEKLQADEASVIAALANGSYSKAFSMSRTNWIKQRNWLINELELLTGQSGRDYPAARGLAFAEKLAKNKNILPELLEVMKTWLRDITVCKIFLDAGRPYDAKKMINSDLANAIQRSCRRIPITSLLSKINAIRTAEKALRSNANVRLTLDLLMMRLGSV